MYSFVKHNDLLINDHFIEILKRNNLDDFFNLINFKNGYIYKKKKYRSIVRIDLEEGLLKKVFYLKCHLIPRNKRIISIIPWLKKEDAENEWKNILLLDSLDFNTTVPVAFGVKKLCGLPHLSLTLTENIYGAEKLETYLPKHFPPSLNYQKVLEKRALIKNLALLAKDFHDKGFNHQDFYLGHFFIRPEDNKIFILDVQRMHKRKNILIHDRIKDVAQLFYSAERLGVFTRTDFLRFVVHYFGQPNLTEPNKKFIKKIIAKAKKIAKHDAKLRKRKNLSS